MSNFIIPAYIEEHPNYYVRHYRNGQRYVAQFNLVLMCTGTFLIVQGCKMQLHYLIEFPVQVM